MNTQLTSDQIVFYRENGFLIIDDFLKGSELSSWQNAVDEAVAQHVSRDDTITIKAEKTVTTRTSSFNASICGRRARRLNS